MIFDQFGLICSRQGFVEDKPMSVLDHPAPSMWERIWTIVAQNSLSTPLPLHERSHHRLDMCMLSQK
jgi:hypothetical protein